MSKEHDFVEKVLEETRNGDLKWSWMLFDSLNGYCADGVLATQALDSMITSLIVVFILVIQSPILKRK